MKMNCDGLDCIFCAYPWFMGKPWQDGAYVEYVESDSRVKDVTKCYPLLIIGFVKFEGDEVEVVVAAVCTEEKELPWGKLKKDF